MPFNTIISCPLDECKWKHIDQKGKTVCLCTVLGLFSRWILPEEYNVMYAITFKIVQMFANICLHSSDSKRKGLENILGGIGKVNWLSKPSNICKHLGIAVIGVMFQFFFSLSLFPFRLWTYSSEFRSTLLFSRVQIVLNFSLQLYV